VTSSPTQTSAPPNRWLIAVAGIVTQTLLGTVYSWSVFKKPFMTAHGWSNTQVGLAFTILVACIGLSAALGGKFVDRMGARRVATLAVIVFSLGVFLAGVADHLGSLPLLWVGYGVLGGLGNGLAYLTPIAVLIRWFPDKRGLITGLAVMGFGLGAALMGQVGPILILHLGLGKTFVVCSIIYLLLLLTAARMLDNPPPGWAPVDMEAAEVEAAREASCDLHTALRMGQFFLLWIMLFVNISAGLALTSNLSPLAQGQLGVTPLAAGTIVLIGFLTNGFGRVLWSWLSDFIGRRATFLILLGTQVPLYLLLPHLTTVLGFTLACCYLLSCFGGGFATMPAFAADTFGPRCLGQIYGKILLAWSAAGLVGPTLMEQAQRRTGSFTVALEITAGLLIMGVVMALLYRPPTPAPD
jgi:MFS transporter, OFA family, oxalate/formate antiporter